MVDLSLCSSSCKEVESLSLPLESRLICNVLWLTGESRSKVGLLNFSLKRLCSFCCSLFRTIFESWEAQNKRLNAERLRCQSFQIFWCHPHPSMSDCGHLGAARSSPTYQETRSPLLSTISCRQEFSFLVPLTSTWNVSESYHLPRSS